MEIAPSANAATVVGAGDVTVNFKRANAVLFAAADVCDRSMTNRGAVSAELQLKKQSGEFPASHVVVTDVLIASSLTVLMSGSRNESLTLKVAVPIGTPVGPAQVAAGLGYSGGGATEIRIVGQPQMTPLFRLMRPPSSGLGDIASDVVGGILGPFRGSKVPRFVHIKIREELSDVSPGVSVQVLPLADQQIVIASTSGDRLSVRIDRWGPLVVDPIAVSGVREVFHSGVSSEAAEGSGLSNAHAYVERADRDLKLSFDEDVPIVIEDPSGRSILARALSQVDVGIADKDSRRLPTTRTAAVEYVDFDAVYAATESQSE